MVPGENAVKFFPKGILSPTMAVSCLILVSITSLASGSRLNGKLLFHKYLNKTLNEKHMLRMSHKSINKFLLYRCIP